MLAVFEGVDGSGKSTLVRSVSNALALAGLNNVVTREPGGTPSAEDIRKVILSHKFNAYAEAYLFFAARQDHWQNLIKPSIEAGKIVLCDRFLTSTWVYQVGEGQLVEETFLRLLEELYESAFPETMLVQHEFILDVPYEVAYERLSARSDQSNRFDTVNRTMFEKRRLYYMKSAQVNTWAKKVHVLDASKSVEELTSIVVQILKGNNNETK